MKKALIVLFLPLATFFLGTYYGWNTGVTDGRMSAAVDSTALFEAYSKARSSDSFARDRIVDAHAVKIGTDIAAADRLTPFSYLMKPKIENGLMELAASYELNSDLPNPWGDAELKPLFRPGSKEDRLLAQAKIDHADYYKRILEEQRKNRESSK